MRLLPAFSGRSPVSCPVLVCASALDQVTGWWGGRPAPFSPRYVSTSHTNDEYVLMYIDSMSPMCNINLYNGMLELDRYQKCAYDMRQRKVYIWPCFSCCQSSLKSQQNQTVFCCHLFTLISLCFLIGFFFFTFIVIMYFSMQIQWLVTEAFKL